MVEETKEEPKTTRDFLTWAEVLHLAGVSDTHMRKLIAMDIGPRTTRLGGKVLIAVEDYEEWKHSIRFPRGRAAKIVAENARMASQKSKRNSAMRKDRQGGNKT